MGPFRSSAILAGLLASCSATADAGDSPIVLRTNGAVLSLSVETCERRFPRLPRGEIERWVRRSAAAVATYYGRFPVARASIEVVAVEGSAVAGGTTVPSPTPSIRIRLGEDASPRTLLDDWILPHEMVHLAMPTLPDDQLWLEEGVASYVEPIARAQALSRSAEQVMLEWVRGMPQGQPERGDRGLDRTHTWGRTYWGGALFCLLADVEIRERTGNRFGLQDALRAVMNDLGDHREWRSIDEVIETADAAVGVPVLRELYEAHARRGRRVDLEDLWRRLGIRERDGEIETDDSAPLASVRRAILEPRTEPPRNRVARRGGAVDWSGARVGYSRPLPLDP